jgi:serine/threonine protein kinase/Tfp pilus assembly protein PilF
MIGKKISHYKIIEKLGEGGMGEVYLAEDLQLERKVAIKFLPQNLTVDKENIDRFKREAKTAASINHSNIVTIYEIAEENEQIFIVMEYVIGKTLKELIAENSQFPCPNYIDIINQICNGLKEAHKAGIVHRDIKPANILITSRGEVKILDFGLAKLAGQAQLTKDASTLGTVAYMSPEQLSGKEVDQRTDIWSLGVILYEMIAGELPFEGEYEQAVIYSILNKVLETNKIPPGLKEIISKALTKKKENRYQYIEDFKNDIANILTQERLQKYITLREKLKTKIWYITGGVIALLTILTFAVFEMYKNQSISLHSFAVLPFMNMKNDVQNDFLGYSLADEIIADLSYLQNLSVRPASSVRKYHLKDVDPLIAGNELNVSYILTGSYQIEADDIRLHIELISVSENEIIWQDEIKEKYDNVFRIQDLVTNNVIDGLKIKFSSDERNRMTIDVPKNSAAYDYYQLSLVKPTTTKGNLEAIDFLEKSIEYDSTYAPAYNQLGFRIHSLTTYNLKGIRRLEEAEFALKKALKLNPELLNALGNLARIYTETGRLLEARQLVRQMLNINKNSALAYFVQGYIYRYAGFLEEAREEMEKAVSLDPTDRTFRSLGITCFYLEQYDAALKAFDIDKGSWYALTYQGITLFHLNKTEIAREYFTSVIEMDPESFSANLSSAYRAYIDNNKSEGIQVLQIIEQNNPPDADMWYLISTVYALFGDKKRTLNAISEAVDHGFYIYFILEKKSYFRFILNDPEFQKILERAREKHESLKKILLNKN